MCAQLQEERQQVLAEWEAKLNSAANSEAASPEHLRGWLEGLNDEDLGKYKM